ncbi:MAG: ComEC/Rec2 family competence protein [Oscillospiraceae bacterium]|nr:ComEC/Rec2 family competence protein [Oscillospiraceae bacterium]
MERQRKTPRRAKVSWKRTAALILAAVCVIGSLAITVTGTWKQVYGFFGLTELGDEAESAPFSLHVLDVGKADALLVCCGDSRMLVDCGRSPDGDAVALYLQKRGISHLDYAICTHPDSDHVGGYGTLLQKVSVNSFFAPPLDENLTKDNEVYKSLLEVLDEKQVLRKTMRSGDTFSLGQAFVQVLWPQEAMDSTNDSSLVLRITYGDTRFLLMGDAGEKVEAQLLSSGEDLRADVLKVGHHGSKTASTDAFLEAVSPQYGVISVGEDRNQLPKDETLRRLEKHQIITCRTDLDGDVLFLSDGKTITAKTQYDAGALAG